MAGSLKWFKYETDFGQTFGVKMDESNGEAVGNPDFEASDTLVVRNALPRNVKPRYATYRTADGRQSANVIVCDPDASLASLPAQILLFDGTTNAALTRFTGEVYSPIPNHVDTGLNDGDIT